MSDDVQISEHPVLASLEDDIREATIAAVVARQKRRVPLDLGDLEARIAAVPDTVVPTKQDDYRDAMHKYVTQVVERNKAQGD